jgi:AcrR family transcriptional regulator
VGQAQAEVVDRVESRRASRRDEILDAAWELAREEGLAGLSMRTLASRVGIRAPSLYAHFDSKDAIYDGMFVRGYREFRAAFERAGAGGAAEEEDGPDPVEVLRRDATGFVSFANDDPVRFQLLFQHAVPGWHPSELAFAVAVEVYEEGVADLARLGITDQAAVDTWTALLTGLASQQVANDPGGDRWLRLVDEAVDMFLARYRPGPAGASTEGHR